jgi:Mitochondrial ribosomal protein L37
MICSSCRRTLLSRLPSRVCSTSQLRYASSAPSAPPSPRQPSSGITFESSNTSPSAISSNIPGISQPLSTPMLPSTSSASSASTPKHPKPPKQQKMVSSIPGGTPLTGLGYLQASPTILAKEDDEYPEWLWTLLAHESGAASKGIKSAADIAGRPSLPPFLVLLHSLLKLTQLQNSTTESCSRKIHQETSKIPQGSAQSYPSSRAEQRLDPTRRERGDISAETGRSCSQLTSRQTKSYQRGKFLERDVRPWFDRLHGVGAQRRHATKIEHIVHCATKHQLHRLQAGYCLHSARPHLEQR